MKSKIENVKNHFRLCIFHDVDLDLFKCFFFSKLFKLHLNSAINFSQILLFFNSCQRHFKSIFNKKVFQLDNAVINEKN